jgi:hypothetical protein
MVMEELSNWREERRDDTEEERASVIMTVGVAD